MDISKSTTLRRKLLLSQADSLRDKEPFPIRDFEEMGEISLQLAMIRKKTRYSQTRKRPQP